MNRVKKPSLNFIFSISVSLIVTIVMSIFLTYNYYETKNKLQTHVDTLSKITLKRLSLSMTSFIESYSINEYQQLLQNEMADKNIVGIVIEDKLTGKILGQESYITGKIRDKHWNIVNYTNTKEEQNYLEKSFLKTSAILFSLETIKIGTISLYYTNQFINEELSMLIKKSLLIVFILSFVLILFLFIAIRNYILNPIITILQDLEKTDQDGFPLNKIKSQSVYELELLKSNINFIITNVKHSKKQLKNYIKRYELTLDAIDDGIWDWNLLTNEVYFSKRWKDMLGYQENEFPNTVEAFFNAIHEDDKQKTQHMIEEHFLDPRNHSYFLEIRMQTKDGSYKWILTRGKVTLNKHKKPIRMLGSHSDITTRKEKEQQLKNTLRQLEQAKKVGKLGIWEIDFISNTFYWSDEFYQQMGLDFSVTPSYENFLSRVHPEDKEYIQTKYQETLQNKELEFRFLLDDGTIRYMKAFSTTFYDEHNNPLQDISAVYDVTDLQKERIFISTIIDNANAIIAVIDSQGKMLKINKYAKEFTGYSEEEIASKPYFWKIFLPENMRDEVVGIVEKANQGKIIKHSKNSWISKFNEERVFEWSNALVKKEDGSMDYIATIGIDVTEKEKIQQKIINQKREFETIFEYSKDGIAILDLESNFLEFNNAYLEITGFTREELLSKSCIGLTTPEEQQQTQKAIQNVFKIGHLENFEKTWIVKDNKRITINMSIVLLPDKKRLLIFTKDITSLKLLEGQSKLASMGEMIGNIAHQWRQPLSIITTSVTGMKFQAENDLLSKEKIGKYSDLIVQQAEYLSNTIDNFRNFIKGNTDYVQISIKDVINQTLALVDASLKDNYIQLINTTEDDIEIYGNSNELTQALINIINNAKDALKEKVSIESDRLLFITTKKIDDNSLELEIKDSAGGIPLDIIDRIFEPYFTTKHKSIGTGLGLTMAYKIIVERHNQIIITNNEEFQYHKKHYKGACFKLVFQKSTLF